MATTATTFTLDGAPFPYIGIGVPAAQLITPIPSAEVVFQIILGVITVAAAGEDQSLRINCVLPRSFCWVLSECCFRIASADADNWDSSAQSDLVDSQASSTTFIPIAISSQALVNLSSVFRRTYKAKAPTKLIVPQSIDDGQFSVLLGNSTIDGAAGTVTFYSRFLRYDRNQAQFWQVNTPVLTR